MCIHVFIGMQALGGLTIDWQAVQWCALDRGWLSNDTLILGRATPPPRLAFSLHTYSKHGLPRHGNNPQPNVYVEMTK